MILCCRTTHIQSQSIHLAIQPKIVEPDGQGRTKIKNKCLKLPSVIPRLDPLRIEPDGQRPVVVIHGLACSKSLDPKCSLTDHVASPPGIMVTLDISQQQVSHSVADDPH
jgi:hypothetical protein